VILPLGTSSFSFLAFDLPSCSLSPRLRFIVQRVFSYNSLRQTHLSEEARKSATQAMLRLVAACGGAPFPVWVNGSMMTSGLTTTRLIQGRSKMPLTHSREYNARQQHLFTRGARSENCGV
jgi:hypothetical protein